MILRKKFLFLCILLNLIDYFFNHHSVVVKRTTPQYEQQVINSNLSTFDIEIDQMLFKGWWFDP